MPYLKDVTVEYRKLFLSSQDIYPRYLNDLGQRFIRNYKLNNSFR